MQRIRLSVTTGALAFTLIGCAAPDGLGDDPIVAELQQGLAAQAQTALGQPFASTDPVRFAEASENFAAAETIEEGIGPTFNERSCGACHGIPALGGSGTQIERRFGRVRNGVFFGFDRAPENHGGTLRQLFSVEPYLSGATSCTIALDAEPASATVHNAGRRSLPLFGLGLIDAMPDAWFELLAQTQPADVRGTVIRAIPQFPDVRDPSQSLTRTRVARFGIKNQQTNLISFAGDAYTNEMGITTQSCYRGSSILAFAGENYPNNIDPAAGCNGGDLAPANPRGNPNIPEFTDDVVGDCAGGLSEEQDDIANFKFFIENLAPPAPDLSDPVSFALGAAVFVSTGCADCHSAVPFVTPSRPFNGVPGNTVFFPFSDFLAHDMGNAADFIGNTGDRVATTRLMRTPPLWGARFNTQFWHDGRAKTVREAILAHDGQGRRARTAFVDLGNAEERVLLKFLGSL